MCSWDLETIEITTPNQRSIFGIISPVKLARSIRFVDNYIIITIYELESTISGHIRGSKNGGTPKSSTETLEPLRTSCCASHIPSANSTARRPGHRGVP
jgi:hypothetical protein